MKISNRSIGISYPPLVIAEMSGNHNQSLERAIAIVEAAAESGAHALKLQTYTADTITLDVSEGEFFINDKESLWEGNSLYDLYEQAHTPWDWHKPIMEKAAELGLICFSSPFDESAVDFLEELSVPAYKIASFEINHIPLIRKVAKTGKPMIISTGMASFEEIEEAVVNAKEAGAKDIILLKCTSSYPSTPKNSNLFTIADMKKQFNCEIGISDHTMGIGVSVAAVAHGASVIEKHFTLSRDDEGVDSDFSLEPNELNALVTESERAWQALGEINYGPTESEKNSLIYKRSIYVAEAIKEGEIFTNKNVRIIRPAKGLHPRHIDEIIGKKSKKELKKGQPFSWDMI